MACISLFQGPSANQIIIFLRSVQQSSIILTAFIASYFVYWHIVLRDPIPVALVPIIVACVLAYLENYIASAVSVYNRESSPKHSTLLPTHAVCSLLMIIGYATLRMVPFVSQWYDGDNWFKPTRVTKGYKLSPAGIEEHHRALTYTIVICGAIALASTLLITTFYAVGYALEKKPWKKSYTARSGGYATVEDAADNYSLFSDDTITVTDDAEK